MAVAARNAVLVMVAAFLLVSMETSHAQPVKFGYSGANGPDKWGTLDPNYTLCSSGKSQSPINIEKKDLVFNSFLNELDRNYFPTNATLINNRFNVELLFQEKGAGTAIINGKKYTLRQFHWHTPSEHTINGEQYPVELHLVHRTDDGNAAVVSILYQYGYADSFVDYLKDKFDQLAKKKSLLDDELRVAAGEVDTRSLRRHTRRYYQYIGSLTIPPCSEGVIWTILGKVRSISKEQVAMLRAPLDDGYRNNSRPTQAPNGRTVWLYAEHNRPSPNHPDASIIREDT